MYSRTELCNIYSFTDFLVYEVNQDSEVVHVKSLEMPRSDRKKENTDAGGSEEQATDAAELQAGSSAAASTDPVSYVDPAPTEPSAPVETIDPDSGWTPHFDDVLKPYISEVVIAQLKQLFEEGVEPPFVSVSDSGWAGRQAKTTEPSTENTASETTSIQDEKVGDDGVEKTDSARGGKRDRGRGRDRGGRGGRGRGGGRAGGGRVDNRKVISDVRPPHDDALHFQFSPKTFFYILSPPMLAYLSSYSQSHPKRRAPRCIKR